MIPPPPRSTLFPYTTLFRSLLRHPDSGRSGASLLHSQRASSRRIVCGKKRSEEHTSELQSHVNLVCRLLLEKKKVTGCAAATSATVAIPSSTLIALRPFCCH